MAHNNPPKSEKENVMDDAILDELYRLQAGGVSFVVGNCWDVCPEDALAFVKDRDATFAMLEGVTTEQWIAYCASDPWLQCTATTKKGARCANIAAYITLGVRDWVAKKDVACCAVHRNDKAEIRRLHDMLDEAADADGEIAGHRGEPDDFAPPSVHGDER